MIKLFKFIFLILIWSVSSTAVATPISVWHMDEDSWNGTADEVIDSSGNDYHGTAKHGAQPQAGQVCNAAQFDGISFIQVASNADFNAIGKNNANYSVSFWLKLNGAQRGGWVGIIHKGATDIQRTFAAWLTPSVNSIHQRISTNVNSNEGTWSSVYTLQSDKWEHVTFIKDGYRLKTYINGTLDSQANINSSVSNSGLLYIGRSPWYYGIVGLIDELLIFDRALSESEIVNIRTNNLAGNDWDGGPSSCSAPIIDHLEISYAKAGLTCSPSSVTIKACADADCTTVITDDVDVTLSPTTGWASNQVTITAGEVTLELNHSATGNVELDITADSITPINANICRLADGSIDRDCSITVAEAGFVFNVPTLTACKPSAAVTIRAVKQGDNTNQCVSALSSNQTVSFWSDYDLPTTGSNPVKINGTDIATSSIGTDIDLIFDINGEAQFTTQYNDAGKLNLTATYNDGNGLVMTGSELFISKPVTLVAYSSAACASQDASCSLFKKAGDTFDLKVKAACWTDDADTDFTDNPVTPNFALNAITITPSLISPLGGSNGNLDVSSFNFATSDSGTHTISQAISEVGVFTFGVTPPNYFGETLSTTDSRSIGRFYPDHFKITSSNDGAFGDNACTGSGFSYSGQNFSYSSNPNLTITAYNAATTPAVTQNYTGDFVKLAATDFSVSSPTTDATQLGADNTNLARLLWAPAAPSLTDNADGSLRFSFGNDSYRYLHEANSLIGPFNNTVNLIFTAITDSDSVSTKSLPHTLQPGGESIRFGRLAIANAHGSELVPLDITVQAEYFNGTNWQTNTVDQCTTLNLASHFQLNNTGSWVLASSAMIIEAGSTTASLTNNSPLVNGSAVLTLSAPGEDNQGYVDIGSQLSSSHSWLLGDYDGDGSYDDDPLGRASFGLFKGSDNILFRRELY